LKPEGTLRMRLQRIREEITYIRRTPLTEGAPYKSAVAHELLLQKVRPFMVRAGILWRPITVEVLSTWHGLATKAEKLYHWSQVRTTVRFERADEPADFLDVQVLTDGWDDADKADPKAMTYADKAALISVLSLERGDDPDFDVALSGVEQATSARVKKLRDLVASSPTVCGADPDVWLRGELVKLARARGRTRVPSLWHLTDDELDQWIADLQDKIAKEGNHASAHEAGPRGLLTPSGDRAPR